MYKVWEKRRRNDVISVYVSNTNSKLSPGGDQMVEWSRNTRAGIYQGGNEAILLIKLIEHWAGDVM